MAYILAVPVAQGIGGDCSTKMTGCILPLLTVQILSEFLFRLLRNLNQPLQPWGKNKYSYILSGYLT